MNNIEILKELMKQSNNIEELIATMSKEKFIVVYMRQADDELKKEQGINPGDIWHRFLVETSVTPVNKWENITNYTTVLISDDLQDIKVIDKT